LADKFDFQKLLGGSINQAYDISSIDTELLLVLSQIQRSVLRGLAAPGYYEAKVIELLALMEQERQACKHAESHHSLPASDLCAVCQAKTILAERLANPPTIAELAELTATSKRKLQSDFKQAFGCTIHEHLQRLRMDKALSLMNDADMALYQVAYAVGYKKAGYFSEIFKKQYGISPEAYRRQYRKR
jgi:transcriptional regulator GlxA family with amidase domain